MDVRVRCIARMAAFAALLVTAALAIPVGVSGAATARSGARVADSTARVAAAATAGCIVHSLPTFTAQGEFGTTATVADVIEVECDPLLYGTGSKITVSAPQLFSRCGTALTWYALSPYREVANTPNVSLALDADGNATVALIAGPQCQAGESLISAHMDEPPFESFTTSFSVLPPGETPEGVMALPAAQVEDAGSSSVATIIQAEFPGRAEQQIRIASNEMLSRCGIAPHLHWIRPDRTGVEGVSEVNGLGLDNDGNTFVLLIGDASCYPGSSLIEADLESKPFTTLTTEFAIEPPQPTAEPAFTIEKQQQIAGSGHGFTTSPLQGLVGQTVEYEIVVTNTASVPETLSEFADPHCDAGTIGGGPEAEPLASGQSTTFTCRHVLSSVGAYVNQASVTARSSGGNPLTQPSNPVEVTAAKPDFTIEKFQQIAGSQGGFVITPLTGVLGETVDYQIIVKDTGETTLAMSDFTDARCDPGTIAGGPGPALLAPGEQSIYTCQHVLASVGPYINEASVTATPPGGQAMPPKNSAPVEVIVGQAPVVGFTVGKRQRVGGAGDFTAAPLAATVGQTVEYEIVVKNTGNAPLTIADFTDAPCDAGTIAGGPGASPLAPGASTTFTCQHVLTSPGKYINKASVAAGAMTSPSNEVEVLAQAPGKQLVQPPPQVGVLARCEASPRMGGISGPQRRPFTVRVSSRGVKRITFYIDGHRVRTLQRSQAKGGQFSIKINPRRLKYGPHRVSFKTVEINPSCATTASARTFVRPFTARVAPRFTG
jgi:uncharacterized repeat protein (TIGR01451 family)